MKDKEKPAPSAKPKFVLLTRQDAAKSGIPFDEPNMAECPWCGKELEPLGSAFGGRIRWVSHQNCGCSGERGQEKKERAEKRRLDEEMMAKRVEACGIKRRYRNAQTAQPDIVAYLKSYGEDEGRGLYIHGGVGSGKTYASMALARALIYAGYSVRVCTSTVMLDSITDTYGRNHTSAEGVGRYSTCDMLVIDDMGKENASSWAVNTLFQIINARYEKMLPTVITSQYSIDALEKRMARSGERETAAAIVSRLRQICTIIHLNSRDRRNTI